MAKSVAGAFVATIGLLVGGLVGVAVALLVLVLLNAMLAYLERQSVPPVAVRLEEYRQHLRHRRLAPGTIDAYTLTLNGWFASLGDKRMATTTDVERYVGDHLDWSPTTVNLYLDTISGYYEWAAVHAYAAFNPITNVDRPRHIKRVPKPIEEDDLERALSTANDELRAVLQLGARAGLSAKEIAGLHTRDIMLDEHPRLRVVHGKGGKERVVPLNPKVLEALRKLGIEQTGYVFPGRADGQSRLHGDRKTHVKAGSVSKMVSRHLRQLGVDSTCESLRQRFFKAAFKETKDMRVVQELAGHERITTTAEYTAINETVTAEAVDRL
jgi:integrase